MRQNRDINAHISRGFGVILKGALKILILPFRFRKSSVLFSGIMRTNLRTLCFLLKQNICLLVRSTMALLLTDFHYANFLSGNYPSTYLSELHLGWALKNLYHLVDLGRWQSKDPLHVGRARRSRHCCQKHKAKAFFQKEFFLGLSEAASLSRDVCSLSQWWIISGMLSGQQPGKGDCRSAQTLVLFCCTSFWHRYSIASMTPNGL